ncbi:calmodulin-like 38 [Perilla frutescens var. hirtella]|uniref:Calmodulin-like 38 n=1 Tax=Perilla frutescens var. hirtella TaxID=608512 RepID=A0AAD4IYC4_PERFH|nr:calmodulin-like 38 [Perilla frutescens var. hirtella]KAH6811378.1 calmodulin-like 38 [Perilla frutescens var. frutescens]KAH6823790.1 calmodulin-like 38 [Perilla frutescens var. hirtella]
MEKYLRVFKQFDSNGDGKICPVELQRCVGAIVGEMTEEEAADTVALLDSDGDGLLSLEDFVRVVEDAAEEEKASDLKAAFKMYEMEGSGCITPNSLRRMLSKLGERRSIDQCGDMIAPFDLNADGVLSFQEFQLMMHGAAP